MSSHGQRLAEAATRADHHRRWPLIVGGLAVIAVTVVAGWWFLWRGLEVTAVTPYRGTAAEIVYATGSVEPVRWAKVATLVKGRIVERCRCEGRHVKAGDVLARLDDTEAQASLRELRARQVFDQKEYDRQQQLSVRGVTTQQALERAESEVSRTEALIAAQVERIANLRLTAPIDGVVLRENGEVGEIVDSNVVLYQIGLPKPLWVVAEVNEEDIPRVHVGQTVLLRADAFGNEVLKGKVQDITPAGDPVAKTFRIHIELPDDTPLRIGMSVEANIVVREKENALLVPATAVVNDGVYVIDGGHARRRKVEIGIRGTRAIEILSGLDESEQVIAPATTEVTDGLRVRVTKQTTPP